MASTSTQPPSQCQIEEITRREIGELLKKYKPEENAPIDCFFFQIYYPFRKWVSDQADVQYHIEDSISKIADEFFEHENNKKPKYGTWKKVGDGWPLTYFLDAQKPPYTMYDRSGLKHNYGGPWYSFEECLNQNIRLKLRAELKRRDQSFRDMPIVFMRACKYTTDDCNMDTSD